MLIAEYNLHLQCRALFLIYVYSTYRIPSNNVRTQIMCFPKEKAMLCLFSSGITHFWGADIIRGDTVYQKSCLFPENHNFLLLFRLKRSQFCSVRPFLPLIKSLEFAVRETGADSDSTI